MREIILISKTYGQKIVFVDDKDYDYLSQFNWSLLKDENTFYASRRCGKKRLKMHREILGISDSDIKIDHRDLNGLNNQRGNLRIATNSQNNRNRRPYKNSSSKYLGVTWRKDSTAWEASIKSDGKNKYLGHFKTEEDAALAYNKAAKEVHGEFANLNNIK